MGRVTFRLSAIGQGEREALGELYALLYPDSASHAAWLAALAPEQARLSPVLKDLLQPHARVRTSLPHPQQQENPEGDAALR